MVQPTVAMRAAPGLECPRPRHLVIPMRCTLQFLSQHQCYNACEPGIPDSGGQAGLGHRITEARGSNKNQNARGAGIWYMGGTMVQLTVAARAAPGLECPRPRHLVLGRKASGVWASH